MTDFDHSSLVSLIRQGYKCFGDDFACTLRYCKSSKQYAIYDKYGGQTIYYGFCCSYDEASRVLNHLRRLGHDVNYIVVYKCRLLGEPVTGQLSLNI